MENLRRLDDPSNAADTLLTLPLSDFPNTNAAAAADAEGAHETRDGDGLVLLRLPPAKEDGGLTMDDLVRGESVYILGDTSERDINPDHDDSAEGSGNGAVGGSIEPVAARLIVEGGASSGGKTLELTRVETSNTYIVVPPISAKAQSADRDEGGSRKRPKLDVPREDGTKELVTMPARSVGLVPGEDSPSCFFLDPARLGGGHFAAGLRGALGRWTYDPFDPPAAGGGMFGYTASELAHVCRTSRSEIDDAIRRRALGAEDALAIPPSSASPPPPPSSSSSATRYGMLSEEGRQTVAMAIVSTLLESDLELAWEFPGGEKSEGMELAPLVEEIRSHWRRLEGEEASAQRAPVQNPYLSDSRSREESQSQSQFGTPSQPPPAEGDSTPPLPEEVVWHCLRPVLRGDADGADDLPERARLLPDEVARLAAHHAFLRGTPKSSSSQSLGAGSAAWWEEEELTEAWSTRLPSMSSKYEPRIALLRGIAFSEAKEDGATEDEGKDAGSGRRWRYFPEEGLPSEPSLRIKSMFAVRDVWTLEEAMPYLEKFIPGRDGGEGSESESAAVELLGRHAKAVKTTERQGGDGKEVSVTKYVAIR